MVKGRGSRKTYHPDDHVEILIHQARSELELRKGTRSLYHTPWLIVGEIGSGEWVSQVPNSDKTLIHSFDRGLADGSNLLDDQNHLLLEAIQRSAILSRNGVTTQGHMTSKHWTSNLLTTINFASWVTMHRLRFQPELYGFARVNLDDYKAFLNDFAKGGWTVALKCPERIIAHFYKNIDYPKPLEETLSNLQNLDQEFIQRVCDWLAKNNLYCINGSKLGSVSRRYLYEHVGLPGTAGNKQITAFLRQFEPHLQGELLTPSVQRGLPSHRAQTLSSVSATENGTKRRTFTEVHSAISDLFKSHPHLSAIVPAIEYHRKEALLLLNYALSRGEHTRLIPLTIGMHALNMACKWVLEFGPTLVQATIYYAEAFSRIPDTVTDPWKLRNDIFQDTIGSWEFYDYESDRSIPLVDALNIKRFSTRVRYICNPRTTDFHLSLQAFIGACVVLIGLLKPMRDQEIMHLPRNCFGVATNGGSELTHEQLKAGILGINPDITRAIPSITARAIQLLQLLGSNLKDIYQDDGKHSDLLFYFPLRGLRPPQSAGGLRDRINACLDQFCNMIEIPLDKAGRRWYIRIHEMRKFFILVSHRHGGEQLNQLLRSQAGHKDESHLASYTAPEISDEDYVRYESECIDDKIIALEAGLLREEENEGLVTLYNAACKSFNVTSILSIPPIEVTRILSHMRSRGDYTVTTYSATLEDFDGSVETMDFAIKYGEKSDAKFNKN